MTARPLPPLRATAVLLLVAIAGVGRASAAALAAPAAAAAPTAPAALQDVGSPEETLAAQSLAAIATGIEDRDGKRIEEALEKLDPVWEQLSAKTIQKVVKAIGNVFTKYRPRLDDTDIDVGMGGPLPQGGDPNAPYPPAGGAGGPLSPGGEDEDKYGDDPAAPVLACYSVAIGLVHHRPQGPDTLLPVLDLPHVKAWPEVQALILQGLGFREDPALLKTFAAYLPHPSPAVASQAARALGRLAEQPLEVRRRAVDALIDALEAADKDVKREAGKVREDEPTPAADYQANIFVGFHEALMALTRQSLDTSAEWRAWFTAHGKEDTW